MYCCWVYPHIYHWQRNTVIAVAGVALACVLDFLAKRALKSSGDTDEIQSIVELYTLALLLPLVFYAWFRIVHFVPVGSRRHYGCCPGRVRRQR